MIEFDKGLIDDESCIKVNMNSESCIDNIDYMVKIDNNKIVDVRFDGEACAISTSASSIIINLILNKNIEDILNIIYNYENMIEEKPYDKNVLEEANVYDDICKQANRKKCALLPILGLKKVLENYKGVENV